MYSQQHGKKDGTERRYGIPVKFQWCTIQISMY